MLGFLNGNQPPRNDALGGGGKARRKPTGIVPAPPATMPGQWRQQVSQQQPAASAAPLQFPARRASVSVTAATPPMYNPPTEPLPLPSGASGAGTGASSRLEMWRRKRAEKLAEIPAALGAVEPSSGLSLPPAARIPIPQIPAYAGPPAPAPEMKRAIPPPVAHTTAAAPIVDLGKLREELVSLVMTQAPKVDLDQRLLPFNQRLQDMDLKVNQCKGLIEDANTSVKALQLQAGQDRRKLLGGVSVDDFKSLHEDLSAALNEWLAEVEETLSGVLQEFSDRIYSVFGTTLVATPILKGPSMLEATADTDADVIPAGTRIKVCYPQVQTAEGVFVRYMTVESETGQIALYWLPLYDQVKSLRFVSQFSTM